MWYRCFIEPYQTNKIENSQQRGKVYFLTAKTYPKPKAALAMPDNNPQKTVPGRNQNGYHQIASANVIIAS